jgi:hypothetical protein
MAAGRNVEMIDRYGAGDPERSRAYAAEKLGRQSRGDSHFFEPSDMTGQFSGRENCRFCRQRRCPPSSRNTLC